MSLPTIEVLFAPSVVGVNTGTRLVLDSAQSPLNTGTLGDGSLFYDISNYFRSIETTRGRTRSLDRFATGTCTIVLDNRDRRFDPTNTASDYYNATVGVSGVVPGVPIIVRATWAGTTYTVFRGFIDSWSFAYGEGGVGDATATINCSDAFKALSAVVGGLPNAAGITSSGTTTVDVGSSTSSGGYGVASVGSYDVISSSTTYNVYVASGTATTPIIGVAGELTGARITRILDAAGWPTNLRRIDTGTTSIDVQNASQTVLEMLQEVAETEAGALYVEDDGSVVFQDRYALIGDARSLTNQAVYDTTVAGGKYFADVEIAYDDQLIRNVIRVSRKTTTAANGDSLAGTTVMTSNVESQSIYGARALDLELPIPSTVGSDSNYGQSQASGLALFLASIYANPELRPASLSFIAQSDEAQLYPELLGRRIFDRVNVKFNVPGGGAAISRDCFIEKVSHSIGLDRWQTSFGLASATYYTGFFILDNASFGVLDSNKLAY